MARNLIILSSSLLQVADAFEDLTIQQDDDLAADVAVLASLKLQHLLHQVSRVKKQSCNQRDLDL